MIRFVLNTSFCLKVDQTAVDWERTEAETPVMGRGGNPNDGPQGRQWDAQRLQIFTLASICLSHQNLLQCFKVLLPAKAIFFFKIMVVEM